MYTAMLTVENIFGADHDIWTVNVEEEYHERAPRGATPPCCHGVSPPPGVRESGRSGR